MKTKASFGVVLDLRCLQDPGYASRGVGRHTLALLAHAPHRVRLLGLVDETLPPLHVQARSAVERVYSNAYRASRDAAADAFVMLSPMTHDPIFVARLLSDPALLRAAVVYDFIQYHWPDRYLPTPAARLAYALQLRWLARCSLFAPISESSADELIRLTGVTRDLVAVTGASIDPIFEQIPRAAARPPARHILMVGGGEWRKNPQVLIRAHARTPLFQDGHGIPLVIAGNYDASEVAAFRAIATAAGGRADLVEVPGHISESELLGLFAQAFALVSASRDEGFSLPVVEGMAAGLPCIVSDIPAHAELVTDQDSRFQPDDDAALGLKLQRALTDTGWRAAALARQAAIWPRFRAAAVAGRFWDALLERLEGQTSRHPSPSVLRGCRPRVALLSPVPPDRSGVADYTAATCAELGKLVDLHVFTETLQPSKLPHVTSVRPLDLLPHVSNGFDRVISVVGNSHFHVRIFELLRRYGGACIAHDARMVGFYYWLIGAQRAQSLATKELGRLVLESELKSWAEDDSKTEALLLGEIAEIGAPTIVHSPITARLFRERYSTDPVYLPFSIYRPWTAAELAPACRAAARARLGLPPGEIVIATFGFVHDTKAPEECIWALEFLRGWGIPASLHFVGDLRTHLGVTELQALVARLGLTAWVHFEPGHVSEQTYRDYLVGADLGVQLRTYGLGALSGGLLDCAAAGLRAVTNDSLGQAVDAPSLYTRRIPDAISPLLLAEALADLLEADLAADRREQARQDFSEARSFTNYTVGLCHGLGLEPAAPSQASRVA